MNSPNFLEEWYKKPFGQFIKMHERMELASSLSQFAGSYLIQLGSYTNYEPSDQSNKLHKLVINTVTQSADVCGNYLQLPFPNDSVELILLPHTLEVTATPIQKMLAEVWRILAPGGHVLILGFNPWSWWNLCNTVCKSADTLPPLTHRYSLQKICTNLQNYSAEIVVKKSFGYFSSEANKEKHPWQEQLGRFLLPYGGIVYLLIAKKQLIATTLLKTRWNWETILDPKGASEPSVGRVRHD